MLDMKERDLKYLCDHMGHQLNIHTSVYSLQTSIVERSKVAAILAAANSGKLHKMGESTSVADVNIDQIEIEGT